MYEADIRAAEEARQRAATLARQAQAQLEEERERKAREEAETLARQEQLRKHILEEKQKQHEEEEARRRAEEDRLRLEAEQDNIHDASSLIVPKPPARELKAYRALMDVRFFCLSIVSFVADCPINRKSSSKSCRPSSPPKSIPISCQTHK